MSRVFCKRCGRTYEIEGNSSNYICEECKTKKTGNFKWGKYILFVIAIIVVAIIGKCTGTEIQ